MVIEIADPAVVRLLNPNPYAEESVFAAEDSEIPGAGGAAAPGFRKDVTPLICNPGGLRT